VPTKSKDATIHEMDSMFYALKAIHGVKTTVDVDATDDVNTIGGNIAAITIANAKAKCGLRTEQHRSR
jgi:hypothetical protein